MKPTKFSYSLRLGSVFAAHQSRAFCSTVKVSSLIS